MYGLLIVIFLFLFGVVLAAISFGLKFLETDRKRRVSGMLATIEGRTAEPEVSVLVDPDSQKDLPPMLQGLKVTERLEAVKQQAGVDWKISHLVFMSTVTAILGLFLGSLFPFLIFRWLTMLVLAVLFAMVPWLLLFSRRRKRMKEFEEQFPDALDFLARSMRAGHAFTISLEMLGQDAPEPVGHEFRTVFNELNLGAPMETVFANLAKRVPLMDVRFFVSTIMLQRQTGGNMSEILQRLGYIIRERFKLRGQVKAASAHGRITALVLTFLPLATVIALSLVAPTYLPMLADDPDGKWLIVAAMVAQLVGYLTMRKIVNIKV
jgi:tight adherence protein B